MNQKRLLTGLSLAALSISLNGCATPTVGQQFRDVMAQIDADCRRDKLGPYLDKNDPDYIQKHARTDCDILKVKPADPLATEEGRFAYSIRLPGPHGKVQTQYQPGMSAETYFKELCEKDAGEWIYRTVEGVEGVFQERRNILSQADESALIYRMNEIDEIRTRNMENALVQPVYGRYNYMERPRGQEETGKPYVRFFRGAENKKLFPIGYTVNINGLFRNIPYIVNQEQTDTLKSRYGITWRQIINEDQLENGIRGGETVIYDRKTGEVLAFRRFFGRVWPRSDSRYTRLTNGDYCQPGFSGGVFDFVQTVLVPINSAE